MVTASKGIGDDGLNVISDEVMLKSGRVEAVRFFDAMLSVSFSSSMTFKGSIWIKIVFEEAVEIVY
jgi:hypothetical protein